MAQASSARTHHYYFRIALFVRLFVYLIWNSCSFTILDLKVIYRKVASSNMSCLEAHAGFFRLLMKGIFELFLLVIKKFLAAWFDRIETQ